MRALLSYQLGCPDFRLDTAVAAVVPPELQPELGQPHNLLGEEDPSAARSDAERILQLEYDLLKVRSDEFESHQYTATE